MKSSSLGVRVGKSNLLYNSGALTLIKNYYPNTKIYIFDTISRSELPTIEVTYNQCISRQYKLESFIGHETEPFVDIVIVELSKIDDVRILFTFELLPNTQKINQKCINFTYVDYHEKSDIEKHYMCEGIKDYIRSEQEFLAQF